MLYSAVKRSETQWTHIFLGVVRQSEFSLNKHKLPLQKLGFGFPFLPQHPFIETWTQDKSSVRSASLHAGHTKNNYVCITWLNVLHWVSPQPVFTSWLCKEQVCIAEFCICVKKCTAHVSVTATYLHLHLWGNVTCGIWKRWILGFSCEFHPLVFSPNPLLSQDTVIQQQSSK